MKTGKEKTEKTLMAIIHQQKTEIKKLKEARVLSGILPICTNCKKIRDEEGNWEQVEVYIKDRSEADFSHGICPECAKKLYPEFYSEK